MRSLHNLLIVLTATCCAASGGDALHVLDGEIDGKPAGGMMHRYLLRLADHRFERWQADYEQRKSPEQIAGYQQRLRKFFIDQIGGLPSERTPLNPRITGTVPRPGYTVEKVIFESQPQHHVTAAFFVPDAARYAPPYPGVLVVCGHSHNGKANEGYQTACALLALNGIAALIVDPIGQGERFQLLNADGSPTIGRPTTEHTLIGLGCIPLGRNTARFEIWDGMRGIDYLQSRDIIDPERIGCMGNSGGGTQTAYLMALDDRIVAASPSCYITNFERLLHTIGPQDAEQNIYNQIQFGMDHADYLMMRAPTPTLICAATHDFFDITGTWDSFRRAKRLYSRLGHAERIDLIENDDRHGYNQPLRVAAVRWMLRWLAGRRRRFGSQAAKGTLSRTSRQNRRPQAVTGIDGRDEAITEPEIELLSEQEIRCTPQGQVMLMEGEQSVFDLNLEENERLALLRRTLWSNTPHGEPPSAVSLASGQRDSFVDEQTDLAAAGRNQHRRMMDRVRTIAGIRKLSELPRPSVEERGHLVRDKARIRKLVFGVEQGVSLPALFCTPVDAGPDQTSRLTIYLDEAGKSKACRKSGPVDRLLAEGASVIAVDLRGIGETEPTEGTWYTDRFGVDGRDVMIAYLLGRSYTGMRAEDVLACARWAVESYGGDGNVAVDLVANGKLCTPALHAAALEPQLFRSVRLDRPLISWSNLVETPVTTDQLVGLVHGALRAYDLPDLAATLGDRLTITNPLDASGEPVVENQ